jgi:hypothetical protein
MRTHSHIVFRAFPLWLLAACATPQADYPSLICRPVDFAGPAPSAAAPPLPVPTAPPGTLLEPEEVSALAARAEDLHARFLSAFTDPALSGRDRGVESDAFARAQLAVAELSTLHGQLLAVLADLDEAYALRTILLADPGPVASLRDKIASDVEEQRRLLATLD